VSIVCNICLTWYSLHCGGSMIVGVVWSKVEFLCKFLCGICCDVGKYKCSSYVCEILSFKPRNTLQIWDCLVCENHFCIHKHLLYSLHTKQTSILKGLIPMKVLATCKDTRWQSMPTQLMCPKYMAMISIIQRGTFKARQSVKVVGGKGVGVCNVNIYSCNIIQLYDI